MAPLNEVARGVLYAVAAFASFSASDALVKLVADDLSLAQIICISSLSVLLPMAVWVSVRGGGVRMLLPKDPLRVGIRMALLVTNVFLAYYAFARLPLANAYTMILTSPLFVTLLAGPYLGEYPGWRRRIAVLLGFIGVLIVLRPGMVELDPGYLAAVGAAVGFAFVVMMTRQLGRSETGASLVFSVFFGRVLAGGVLLPFAWDPMDWTGIALLVGIGWLGMVGQTFVWLAFRNAPAAVVSPFQFSQIVWGALFGYLLFGDVPDRYVVIGVLVIVGSGLYVFFRERKVKAATR